MWVVEPTPHFVAVKLHIFYNITQRAAAKITDVGSAQKRHQEKFHLFVDIIFVHFLYCNTLENYF